MPTGALLALGTASVVQLVEAVVTWNVVPALVVIGSPARPWKKQA